MTNNKPTDDKDDEKKESSENFDLGKKMGEKDAKEAAKKEDDKK